MKRRMGIPVSVAAAALLWAAANPPGTVAQERESAPERAVSRSATATAAPATRPSQPTPAASTRLAAPDVDPLKYVCNSGNCACAGVQDCVDMKDICAPGTMGCNKHGCTCQEGDGGGDGG